MDKDFENYYKFVEILLDDEVQTNKSKMKMIKGATKELVLKELSDYANYNTNNFNTYVDNLRKELK